eukprot:m.20415 g.20415  ORF g.20415 m.20415 type:complete len:346 (-) comp6843_c0_seq1:37-1074(-)
MSYFTSLSQSNQAAILAAYISSYFMLLACLFALLEILLSGKLRFQRYRLISVLMGTQVLASFFFILEEQGQLSDNYYREITKCPDGLQYGIYNGLSEAMLLGALAAELCIAGFGSYSLFCAKREAGFCAEWTSLIFLTLFSMCVPIWLIEENIQARKKICTKEWNQFQRIASAKGQEFWAISLGMACLLFTSYVVMFLYRLKQMREWRLGEVNAQMHVNLVIRRQKMKIINSQKKSVDEVIGFYSAFMVASVLGIIGTVLCFIADGPGSYTNRKLLMWDSGRTLSNIQGFCQGSFYFYNEMKAEGLSWTRITKRVQRRAPGISFAETLNVNLIEEDSQTSYTMQQ